MTTGAISFTPSVEYNNGIYIDIYVLDGYPEYKMEYALYIAERDILEKILRLFNYEKGDNNNGRFLSFIKIILKKIVCKYFEYDKVLNKYKKHMGKYFRSKRIGLQTHNKMERKKYWVRRTDFDLIEYMDFEMIKLPVPKNYDEILSHIYGNYMEFPPERERGAWHEEMIHFEPDISYKDYFRSQHKS